MSFANLSSWAVIAGLVALAALLYALQWLRVRHREVRVVTTLFWSEALEEAPARAFRERFRHLPAYLLLLLICSLLWLALAGIEWPTRADAGHHVLLLDGSAAMARGDRFEQAVRTLEADLRSLDRNRREVIWVGGRMRTLLAAGEDAALFRKRLEQLAPQAAPPMMDHALQIHAMSHHGNRKTLLTIYGDAPVRAEVIEQMPATHTVTRATSRTEASAPNAGITALGITEAASGAWNRVDALVRVESTSGETEIPALEITLDGAKLPEVSITAAGKGTFLLRDLPAAGGLLQAKVLRADSLALDDTASVRMPRRSTIRVQVSPSLRPILDRVLAVDPAIERVDRDAGVVIRLANESMGAGLPALVFTPMDSQPAAFQLSGDEQLEQTLRSLALGQIDATALAQVARRPIEIAMETGVRREMSVWQELLHDDFNFTRSRSFPLFVAHSMRWLAATPGWYPYVAAGEPVPLSEGSIALPFDLQGAPFVPEVAGPLSVVGDRTSLQSALLDSAVTLSGSVEATSNGASRSPGQRAVPDLVTMLLLLALVLLGAEWFFYHRGKLP